MIDGRKGKETSKQQRRSRRQLVFRIVVSRVNGR